MRRSVTMPYVQAKEFDDVDREWLASQVAGMSAPRDGDAIRRLASVFYTDAMEV